MLNVIKLQVGPISIEVSGDADFVEKQFKELSERYVNPATNAQAPKHPTDNDSASMTLQPTVAQKHTAKYLEAGIYSIDDESGTVQIHSEIPGNSKTKKMNNVALIIAYAKNEEAIPMKDISAECKRQGCYDQANFAASIKNDTKNFQIHGAGQNRTIKISVPGKKAAESLLDAMLDENLG